MGRRADNWDDRDDRDDAALVELARTGDREAFARLLLRHAASVDRLCRRLLGPGHEAQDVAQEAAVQAFVALPSLQEPARFGAWLHAIAANLARMALRRRRSASLEALDDAAPRLALWSAGAAAPDEAATTREIHDQIARALNDLSAVNREAATRFFLEG
jgi:RNA polymerase sigma-70 factor (ECF subfamily)